MNFTSTLDICLDKEEKDSKKILQSVTEALLVFVCHDDGDRIACKICFYYLSILNPFITDCAVVLYFWFNFYPKQYLYNYFL
jgi:hypothetical protein